MRSAMLFALLVTCTLFSHAGSEPGKVHVWEMQEITFTAENNYSNFYTDVTLWVELNGPGYSKKIYGFWDGEQTFKVRIVANVPGEWHWKSGSNQGGDDGLNNITGSFTAVAWTSEEIAANPNRRGFIRASANGHALQYADGTPFFMIGDTWLAGATWRLPFRNAPTTDMYVPSPGIGFEDAVMYRKGQGFNSVSMIASFPNWESDINASTYADENGLFVRNAWEKFEYLTEDGKMTSKNMRDEWGNLPFEMSSEHPGVANFEKIIPAYFQSLDKKMKFLSEQGFVPLIETVRRDICPTWKAYFDFNESYSRYVQYLISRYGAYNIFFSGIHLDWIPKEYSLTADEFNEVLTYHHNKYGPLPFGQPYTLLIDNSTYKKFGHAEQCPWLTMHSVGNKPRDHRVSGTIDTLFNLVPPYPAINFEPYYTGWDHEINMPNGERPPADSERDNYFSRAQMYGSVLSGGLSGHVHGTAAYDITTTGEPAGMRPHFWVAMKYESATYMQHLYGFILSEGTDYQELRPAWADVLPQKAPGAPEKGLDGWSYMMRTADKKLAMLYFEKASITAQLRGFLPDKTYGLKWFNTVNGAWSEGISLKTDKKGMLMMPDFPDGGKVALQDIAVKIKLAE